MGSLLLVSGYQDVDRWRTEIVERLPDVEFAVWESGATPDPVDPATVSMIG